MDITSDNKTSYDQGVADAGGEVKNRCFAMGFCGAQGLRSGDYSSYTETQAGLRGSACLRQYKLGRETAQFYTKNKSWYGSSREDSGFRAGIYYAGSSLCSEG